MHYITQTNENHTIFSFTTILHYKSESFHYFRYVFVFESTAGRLWQSAVNVEQVKIKDWLKWDCCLKGILFITKMIRISEWIKDLLSILTKEVLILGKIYINLLHFRIFFSIKENFSETAGFSEKVYQRLSVILVNCTLLGMMSLDDRDAGGLYDYKVATL